MKLLFVCFMGRNRSRTGAELYAKRGYETRYAGTCDWADVPLTDTLIRWADLVVCMEPYQQRKVLSLSPSAETVVLDILDDYEYNDPALKSLLLTRLKGRLPE